MSCNQKAVLGGVCYLFFFLNNLQEPKWPSSCSYRIPPVRSGSFPRLQIGTISIVKSGAAQGARPAKIKKKRGRQKKKNQPKNLNVRLQKKDRHVQLKAPKPDPCFIKLRSVGKYSGAVWRGEDYGFSILCVMLSKCKFLSLM